MFCVHTCLICVCVLRNTMYSNRLVVSTACVLFHRFYVYQSFRQHNRFVSSYTHTITQHLVFICVCYVLVCACVKCVHKTLHMCVMQRPSPPPPPISAFLHPHASLPLVYFFRLAFPSPSKTAVCGRNGRRSKVSRGANRGREREQVGEEGADGLVR